MNDSGHTPAVRRTLLEAGFLQLSQSMLTCLLSTIFWEGFIVVCFCICCFLQTSIPSPFL